MATGLALLAAPGHHRRGRHRGVPPDRHVGGAGQRPRRQVPPPGGPPPVAADPGPGPVGLGVLPGPGRPRLSRPRHKSSRPVGASRLLRVRTPLPGSDLADARHHVDELRDERRDREHVGPDGRPGRAVEAGRSRRGSAGGRRRLRHAAGLAERLLLGDRLPRVRHLGRGHARLPRGASGPLDRRRRAGRSGGDGQVLPRAARRGPRRRGVARAAATATPGGPGNGWSP